MNDLKLKKGGSMIKKVFIAITLVLLIVYVFSQKSDAANSPRYKEVNFNDEVVKVAIEDINELQQHTNQDQYNTMMHQGTVKTYLEGGHTNSPKISTSNIVTSALTSIVATIVIVVTMGLINPFMAFVANGNGAEIWKTDINNGELYFNVGKVLTNGYELFDISYLISGEPTKSEVKTMFVDGFQKEIPNWYLGVRNLALAMSVVVLLYIGIRMAISIVADERAKYKKMFTGWIEGIILMFLMHYIIIAAIQANNLIVNILRDAAPGSEQYSWLFESNFQARIITLLYNGSMGEQIVYAVMLITLIMIQIKFFIYYFQRVLKVALYTIISPLVCMTYAIDKAGDGRAQGFNNWFKEFMMSIFIQPLHLVIYVVFVYTAGFVSAEYPVIGVMFLILLDQSEKLIKRMFNVSPKGKKLHDIKAMKMVKKAVGE